jgi:hypothetical protein
MTERLFRRLRPGAISAAEAASSPETGFSCDFCGASWHIIANLLIESFGTGSLGFLLYWPG